MNANVPVPPVLSGVAAVLAHWGALTPTISAIYLFGSRIRGSHHNESDLDVAIALSGSASAPLAEFIAQKATWTGQLTRLLRMPIDLQLADEEGSAMVWGYLQQGCATVYRRFGAPSA